MFTHRGFKAAGLTAALATSAAAQMANAQAGDRAVSDFVRRSSVSFAVNQTRPQGALGRNIGFGYGLSGAYLFRLDPNGIISLRADAAAVEYGNEWKQAPFSETVGGRVKVNVRTTNYIVPMSVGPQLAWPSGPIRPYVNAGVGAQAFLTESDVEGTDAFNVIALSTNQSDVALMWVAGGGIYVPVVPGLNKVQLDLGMQYVNGGRARYLAPGSIVDLPGGDVRISSLESATRLVKLHIGVRIGL
jgi:hypothetical protein